MKLAIMQRMGCIPPLEAGRETLGFACLPRATTNGGEDEGELRRSVQRKLLYSSRVMF